MEGLCEGKWALHTSKNSLLQEKNSGWKTESGLTVPNANSNVVR